MTHAPALFASLTRPARSARVLARAHWRSLAAALLTAAAFALLFFLPFVSLPVSAGPLGWLAAGLLVAVFTLTGRRMVREPLPFSTEALDGGAGVQEGDVVGERK